MNITLSCFGTFHMHHLASALSAEEKVSQYFTSHPFKSYPHTLKNRLFSYPYIGVLNKVHGRLFPEGKYLDNHFLRAYFDRIVSKRISSATDIYISWPTLNSSILSAKELGIPVVLESGSCHILEVIELYRQERKTAGLCVPEPYYSQKLVNSELHSYQLADYINVPSYFARDSFVKYGFPSNRVFVNPYGVDLSLFTNTSIRTHTNKLRFIYAGRISWKKGIHRLLNAFSHLDTEKTELLLVGDICDHSSYLVKHLPSNVKMMPSVSQPVLADLFSQSDIFVTLSVQEGLSLTQLQALGCGLPVICMHSTGGSNFVQHGDNGFILDSVEYVDQLCLIAKSLISDINYLLKLQKNASCSTPYSLSWSSYATRYLNNISKISL